MKTIQLSENEFKNYQKFLKLSADKDFNKLISILSDRQVMYKFLYLVETLNKTEKNDNFEEWSMQFEKNEHINEPISEYNTTLSEFRKLIFDAEINTDGDLTYEKFKQSLKTW